MKNMVLKVEGMSCGHCVSSVESALKEIGAEGKVDLSSGKVEVYYDEATLSPEQINEAIEEQGYEVK